ncbi:PREDICTED: ankyrin repeat domain-containing protein 12 [Nicrophorus vespilloides]|uniref:Ankyrin repeat domain-containing protein 12 n=1 Tax=Nicrophorus vespilloides TaxID=110193 RepID=A0ABM1MYQ3_NICVS|nr:PREDICTED: ankyrin repeat domain-containing protein 12 [Nicrophorus vespilloides]XP_017779703.1 PREDICTED: ankyrin repeat domain-containing protein 12 [Nicrophorus vespilloides]
MAAPDLVDGRDEDGFTPLHLAVIAGNMPLVTFLLASNADVNAVDAEKHTVVHWATVCGETEALRAVLAAGAPVSTPDVHGGYPLHYAAQMCGGEKDHHLGHQVLQTLLGHEEIIISVEDGDGRQPLLWAASAGSSRAMLALIRAGSEVEASDKDGLTALHCAASRGHTDCLDTLLTLCGASVDVIDSNGCTALHYAVTLGHADSTSLLLAHGANSNRQDRKGRSPAHCGCAKGQFETVKMLGSHGANLWLRNARGDLPLHEAAASGRRDLVKWLLEQRPSQVNARNNDGRCPLHLAAINDNSDMCKILLDSGAIVNPVLRTSKNAFMTPLDCAMQRGFRSTAKYLQLQGGLPASKIPNPAPQPTSGVSLHIRDDITFWGDTSGSEDEKTEGKRKKRSIKRKVAYKYERKPEESEKSETKSPKEKLIYNNEVKILGHSQTFNFSDSKTSESRPKSTIPHKRKEKVDTPDPRRKEETKLPNINDNIKEIESLAQTIEQKAKNICKEVTIMESNISDFKPDIQSLTSVEESPVQNLVVEASVHPPPKDTYKEVIQSLQEELTILRNEIKTLKSIPQEQHESANTDLQELKKNIEDIKKSLLTKPNDNNLNESSEQHLKQLKDEIEMLKSTIKDNTTKLTDYSRNANIQTGSNSTDLKVAADVETKVEDKKNIQESSAVLDTIEIVDELVDKVVVHELLKESKEEKLDDNNVIDQIKSLVSQLDENSEQILLNTLNQIKNSDKINDQIEAQVEDSSETVINLKEDNEKKLFQQIQTLANQLGENAENMFLNTIKYLQSGENNNDKIQVVKESVIADNEDVVDQTVSEDKTRKDVDSKRLEEDHAKIEEEIKKMEEENKIKSISLETLTKLIAATTSRNVTELQKNAFKELEILELTYDKNKLLLESLKTEISDVVNDKLFKITSEEICKQIEGQSEAVFKKEIDENIKTIVLDNLQQIKNAGVESLKIADPTKIENIQLEIMEQIKDESVTNMVEEAIKTMQKNKAKEPFGEEVSNDKISLETFNNLIEKVEETVEADKKTEVESKRQKDEDLEKGIADADSSEKNNRFLKSKKRGHHLHIPRDLPDSSVDAKSSEEDRSHSDESSSISASKRKHKSFTILEEVTRLPKRKNNRKTRPRSEEKSPQKTRIPTPLNNERAKSNLESRIPVLPELQDNKYKTKSESNLARDYSDNEEASEEERSQTRKKKVKRRKARGSKNAGSDYESSNLIDSGFEPSPRSSRIPKWKNVSERGVNMTSVTQSIQGNIRRYHLERKIFQHLLDLKRLQIRSGQHNEAMLVKRAIDTYHKSCASTVGAGQYVPKDFSFKSFEQFLYESLRKIQKTSAPEYLKGLPENVVEHPLLCTQSTNRCMHATHAYTGVPCAAYLPKMDHHSIPKIGFNSCKPQSTFLPDINGKKAVTLELCHGNDKQVISLPTDRLDQNKRYYVTFTVKGQPESSAKDGEEGHRHSKSV